MRSLESNQFIAPRSVKVLQSSVNFSQGSSVRARSKRLVVTSNWFKDNNPFKKKEGKNKAVDGWQGRDDYDNIDVENYFNYMGILAVEGNYDRMEILIESGIAA